MSAVDEIVDPTDLENKSHQLVNSLAFETSVFLALPFFPLKPILNISCGFISSSSRECGSLGTLSVFLL